MIRCFDIIIRPRDSKISKGRMDNNDNDNNDIKIGLRLPQTDEQRATKENIIRFAKEAENAGFDSLWVLERLIWPIMPHD